MPAKARTRTATKEKTRVANMLKGLRRARKAVLRELRSLVRWRLPAKFLWLL
jgi:hypothetical protein